MIGVIGGMGPLATADYLQKVIEETNAPDDASNVPMLISCDPRIPDRPAAILDGAESPLPRLLEIRDRLLAAGATALAMPCNTAHHWYEALREGCPVPFLSIVEASCDEVRHRLVPASAVAIVGTRATLAIGLYEKALQRQGIATMVPTPRELDDFWLPAIVEVKAGRVPAGASYAELGMQALLRKGATQVVLACTELPLALALTTYGQSSVCVDTTRALARATVRHWKSQR